MSSTLLTAAIAAILILLGILTQVQIEQAKLKKRLRKYEKYEGLGSKEELEKQLDSNISLKQRELEKLLRNQEQLNAQINTLRTKLSEVEEAETIQSFGFYKSKYNFGSSEEYKIRLDKIREQQKLLLKSKTAAVCHTQWEVEGSKKKGEKMINNFITLVLRAFNGECDAAILQVRYNNVNKLEKRIMQAFDSLNKLAETNHCAITRNYLNFKLEELYLTHEFQDKKQEEAEEQKRIREQIRQEEKALRELEKAKKDAELEVRRREQALQQARREIEQAVGQQREQLQLTIEQLTQQLNEAVANEQRVISRAQMTKSGHIYVISNVGSFGDHVYKIGMTRRLDPLDRVRELSGASVPFPFDVHAMIFSENAPEMENLLHQYFRDRSVNKVNERKEFFKVTLDEISSAVENIAQETKTVQKAKIQFTKIAEAEQYRKTIAIERGENQPIESNYTPSWDEDEEEDLEEN